MRYDVFPPCQHAENIMRHFEGNLLSQNRTIRHNGELTIVCFTNRCGSTVVCSELSRLGLAGRPNKYLNYEFLNADAVIADCCIAEAKSLEAYWQYCIEKYSSGSGCFATKASPSQLNLLLESGILSKMNVRPKFIFSRRRNVFAQAVSLWTAFQDGRWTSLHESSAQPEVRYDEARILLAARAIYEANAMFAMLFDYHSISPLTVWYEDFSDKQECLGLHLAQYYGCGAAAHPSALPVARQTTPLKTDWEKAIRASAATISTCGADPAMPSSDRN